MLSTVYSVQKLQNWVLVISVSDHDATPTSRGRKTVCTKRRERWCKSTYCPSQYQISVLQHSSKSYLQWSTHFKSNEVKVQVNGKMLQVHSTFALEYFVTLKSNQMLLKYCNTVQRAGVLTCGSRHLERSARPHLLILSSSENCWNHTFLVKLVDFCVFLGVLNFWLTFVMHLLWSRFSCNGRTINSRYDMIWLFLLHYWTCLVIDIFSLPVSDGDWCRPE